MFSVLGRRIICSKSISFLLPIMFVGRAVRANDGRYEVEICFVSKLPPEITKANVFLQKFLFRRVGFELLSNSEKFAARRFHLRRVCRSGLVSSTNRRRDVKRRE